MNTATRLATLTLAVTAVTAVAARAARAVRTTIERTVVYTSSGPLHVQMRPTASGFVTVASSMTESDPESDPPALITIDLANKRTDTIPVQAMPDMQHLVLRLAEQRKDRSFVVSAAWIEKGVPRNGLIHVAPDGKVVQKAGYGISVGRIAILDNGSIAAAIQPPRDAESTEVDRAAPFMLGFFDEDTGSLLNQSGAGIHQGYSGYQDQHMDLMVRTVTPIPGGVVFCQPKTASATHMKVPALRTPSRKTDARFESEPSTTRFSSPAEGPYEVIAIAPIRKGQSPDYLVAWGRKRAATAFPALKPDQKYDEIVLAAYRHGGTQSPTETLKVPNDLWDLLSDGRNVFALSGAAFDWRIEQIALP